MKIDRTILIKIADFLDSTGNEDDANYLDSLIQEIPTEGQELEVDIQEEDAQVLHDLYESLKESFSESKNQVQPELK